MAVADSSDLPLALSACSASPHEVTLVESTLDDLLVDETPQRLFAWLQNYRRILVRFDYKLSTCQGFVHLGAIYLIISRYF